MNTRSKVLFGCGVVLLAIVGGLVIHYLIVLSVDAVFHIGLTFPQRAIITICVWLLSATLGSKVVYK